MLGAYNMPIPKSLPSIKPLQNLKEYFSVGINSSDERGFHVELNKNRNISESTSENSDTFQKKILHKPISSAFALKRSKDLRQSYYDQLISLQILPKDEQKREYNSIIIFDWDDTLFCSSYYIKRNVLSLYLKQFNLRLTN